MGNYNIYKNLWFYLWSIFIVFFFAFLHLSTASCQTSKYHYIIQKYYLEKYASAFFEIEKIDLDHDWNEWYENGILATSYKIKRDDSSARYTEYNKEGGLIAISNTIYYMINGWCIEYEKGKAVRKTLYKNGNLDIYLHFDKGGGTIIENLNDYQSKHYRLEISPLGRLLYFSVQKGKYELEFCQDDVRESKNTSLIAFDDMAILNYDGLVFKNIKQSSLISVHKLSKKLFSKKDLLVKFAEKDYYLAGTLFEDLFIKIGQRIQLLHAKKIKNNE